MAISYRFDMAIDLPLNTFARAVRDLGRPGGLLPADTPAAALGSGVTCASGLWLRVVPNTSVRFRLGELHDEQPQLDAITRLVADLLANLPGDAELSGRGAVWLRRRGDDLVLNGDDALWQPHRRQLLLEPFERETLSLAV